MPADAATIRSTVEAYCAAFSARDRDAYAGLFAEDGWIEDPVGSPRRVGRKDIAGFMDESSALADTIELRLTGPVRVPSGGAECAFPMQARPTIGGATYVVDIIDVMTFADDGKITTMRAFWDPAEMRPADDG